jgi:methyltransferase (TIGR00027 family)
MMLGDPHRSRLAADTAEGMAALRAAGAAEPDERVRNPDHLAVAFVSLRPRLSALVKLPGVSRLAPGIAERVLPGSYWFETARVKQIDAVLLSELEQGLAQLVILGAGFDTRAYRFAHNLRTVQVYEIDHPVTARLKRNRVTRIFGALPPGVTYQEADFAHDDLAARLAAVGYDTGRPTLMILSGVTAYLPEVAVARLLRFAATHDSPRTSIVFDYLYDDMVGGDDRYHGARQLRKRLDALGEPLRFGIPCGSSSAFLEGHGLTLVSDLGPQELAARHLQRSDGTISGRPYGFAAIAHARTVPRA